MNVYCPCTRSSGFTLVELLTTITILGVLLAIGVPSFQKLTLNQGVKSAAFDLFSALQYARSEAIKRPGETVTLKSGAASNGAWSTGWRLEDGAGTILKSWTVASSISVADKNSTALTQVSFAKDGHLTVTPKLEVKPTTTTAGVDARCILVDLIGRANTKSGTCP